MVVILLVVEDVLAIDASHHHVVNAEFRFCPCLSWHTEDGLCLWEPFFFTLNNKNHTIVYILVINPKHL